MIIYHGRADPVFSINDSIRWYEKLNAKANRQARSFVRLFVVPGMTHCGGGVALDKFDALSALVDWVEKGNAPDEIVASVDRTNKDVLASWSPNRTTPALSVAEIRPIQERRSGDGGLVRVCGPVNRRSSSRAKT
jgi:hypothetical protein